MLFRSNLPKGKNRAEGLLEIIDKLKIYRDLFVDYLEEIIRSCLPFSDIVSSLFEKLHNELHDATGKDRYSGSEFEEYDFLIWELFISSTAVCLHYEEYKQLHGLLTHTYFLRESFSSNSLKACDYTQFRVYCDTIETTCKQNCYNPRLFTLMGDILIKRERKPILTKESLSNADLVLYQLHPLLNLNLDKYWYPMSYVYHSSTQNIWQKMKSRQYCDNIKYLFGVDSIEALREIIGKIKVNPDIRYNNCFESPLSILSSIRVEEIGSMN